MVNRRNFEMEIAQRRDRFKMLVPDHITDKDAYLNRLAFECDMLLHQNPRLAQCDPKSIMLAAMEAARHRLFFSQGQCSIIPFKNQAVFVLGVAGIIKILYKTGVVQKVKYGTVYENDVFEFCEGSGDVDFVRHQKALVNRGSVVGAWASATMKDGSSHIYVMDRDELFKVRASSPGYRADDPRNPYNMWGEEMHGKAPLKRLFKRLQLDPEDGDGSGAAVAAMGADLTVRADVDSGQVFFEDAPEALEPMNDEEFDRAKKRRSRLEKYVATEEEKAREMKARLESGEVKPKRRRKKKEPAEPTPAELAAETEAQFQAEDKGQTGELL